MADNVVELDEHRGPPKKESNMAKLYRAVFNRMEQTLIAHKLPDFPDRFYMFRADKGRALVKVSNDDEQIVELCDNETLERAVANYVTMKVLNENYAFTPRQIKDCAMFWRLHTQEIPEPKPFLRPGEDGIGFRRLPWDLTPGPTPMWDRLLGKMTNTHAFRCWIGSLFIPASALQQYVWIHGKGNDGKGAINRFLANVFGSAYHGGKPPGKNDKFWGYYALLGKRLVVFPDLNNSKFVAGEDFKSLTGGDPVAIEEKRGALFSYSPKAKFLALSNKRPEISSEESDIRRLIYCEFDPKAEYITDDGFEETLWREGGAFLGNCIEEYSKTYPKHGKILSDDEAKDSIDSWVSTMEEDFEDAFDHQLKLSTDNGWVEPYRMQEILRSAFHGNRQQAINFCTWMERKYGIRKKAFKQNGKTVYGYFGIVAKHFNLQPK